MRRERPGFIAWPLFFLWRLVVGFMVYAIDQAVLVLRGLPRGVEREDVGLERDAVGVAASSERLLDPAVQAGCGP